MSDRSQIKNLDTPMPQGSSPLETLRASRELGTSNAAVDQGATLETDLSLASIPVTDVPRISAKSDKRILRPATGPGPMLATGADTAQEQESKSAPKQAPASGILKNPHFAYQGDLLERFVTLIANVMKVLERLFLRLLGGGDKDPMPARKVAPIIQAEELPGPDLEKKRREEREKLQRELGHHRS